MTSPWHYCANCDKPYQYHIDEKCPFEASNFKMRKGLVTWEEQGTGIANIGSIKKLQFFEISHINAPADPSK